MTKNKMRNLAFATFLLALFSPAQADLAEYKKIEQMPNLLPLEKIEDTSIWRDHCQSFTQEFNEWLARYAAWRGEQLKKDGKSVYFIAGFKNKLKETYSRDWKICDCLIDKRVTALDTLSKKAADALLVSHFTQCASK
tara:strand:- start:206 stop:619 length:414 start_codon:yes stop_codon:yes gene_type:complete